ncbi:Chromosome partition protein Smc [bacterium HR30]|nr:Chromosome partition protein Smc [bacterium HR30]
MRLKQLEVQGFKSFPHRTVVAFAPGLTAIVGPNGCGKSNVVDAIRWVLGEQSPRLLRGAQMDDVLFKGSDQVPPSNVAEVSLTLEVGDLSNRLDGLEEGSVVAEVLRQCTEVKVTRRLYRSGEAEYLMNGRPCRLRDITEMFLGSGVGARSYSIIEQGRVEQLIVAKPEERRVWIEEAAGTTLFRSRKLAAERKMERTRENLQRVADILRELDRQLNYMRRLAKRAEQARATEMEIRELEAILAVRERERLSEDIAEKERKLGELDAALRAARERLGEVECSLDQYRTKERDALAAWNEAKQQRMRLDVEVEALVQQIALAQRERQEGAVRRGAVEAELEATQRQLANLREHRLAEALRRGEVARAVLNLEFLLGQALRAYKIEQVKLASLQSALSASRDEELQLRQQRSELENQARNLSRTRDDLARARTLLSKEIQDASAQLSATELELIRHRSRSFKLELELADLSHLRDCKLEAVEALKRELSLVRKEKDVVADEVLRMQSRLETLEELRRRYEGFKPGVQKLMLGENGTRLARAVVADVIQVPADLERAVAAALGELVQCLIVENREGTLAAVRRLKEEGLGRGAFIALGDPVNNGARLWDGNGDMKPLAELVTVKETYRPVVERLLAHVALVPKLEDALRWQQSLHGDYLLVTPAGETIDQRGVVTGGTEQSLGEEFLARGRRVQELTEQLHQKNSELQEKQKLYDEVRRRAEAEEQALRQLEQSVRDCSVQLLSLRKDIDRFAAARKTVMDRIEHAVLELRRVHEQLAETQLALRSVTEELSSLSELDVTVQPRRHVLEQQAEVVEKRSELLDRQIRDLELRLATQRERHEALVRTLTRLEQEEIALAERQRSLEAGIRDALEKTNEAGRTLGDLSARRSQLEQDLEQLRLAEERHQRMVEEIGKERLAAEKEVQALAGQVELYREGKMKAELEVVELRGQMEHLRQTVQERCGCALEDLPTRPTEESDEELRGKLKELRSFLEKIGTVGSGVMEELRETEERAAFLRTQRADLEQSLKDVQSTIERLERTSRGKFLTTLEAVQREFSAVVPRLFGGGEGRLVLTDPNDLANSGVEIVVRPPGKRLEAVGLLSGGEKALAAVALIFALFAWHPSPFCILDEVDAPLDDANVARFMELVREMSQNSQFIVITHNKRTMQAAHRLYGVTMQQPGVSTLLAVELR